MSKLKSKGQVRGPRLDLQGRRESRVDPVRGGRGGWAGGATQGAWGAGGLESLLHPQSWLQERYMWP